MPRQSHSGSPASPKGKRTAGETRSRRGGSQTSTGMLRGEVGQLRAGRRGRPFQPLWLAPLPRHEWETLPPSPDPTRGRAHTSRALGTQKGKQGGAAGEL